jgi:hypothetical protein
MMMGSVTDPGQSEQKTGKSDKRKRPFEGPLTAHPNNFGPENGIYLQNVGNTAHTKTLQTLKSRINIKTEPLRQPEIGNVH